MIDWIKSDSMPEGPSGAEVTQAWTGKDDADRTFYLAVLAEFDTVRRYATLGTVGRMPTDEEAASAASVLGQADAQWQPSKGGFGLTLELS